MIFPPSEPEVDGDRVFAPPHHLADVIQPGSRPSGAPLDEHLVTDRDRLRPVRVGLEIAAALSTMYGAQFQLEAAQYLLGSKTAHETELTRTALPGLPFAGLYCTGEIGPIAPGIGSHFLNETFVALLLGT